MERRNVSRVSVLFVGGIESLIGDFRFEREKKAESDFEWHWVI